MPTFKSRRSGIDLRTVIGPLDGLPSEEQRTADYEAELLNRYRTGQFLTETDKREARSLLRRRGEK